MLDGATEVHGAIDGNGVQVGKQLAEITAVASYSFVVSCILLLILKYIPGMHLRVTDEAEEQGLDRDQFYGEEIGDAEIFEELAKRGLSLDAILGQAPTKGSSTDQVQTEPKKVD